MTAATHQLLSPLSITPSKTNPRKRFDDAYLNELAENIKKVGVLQPLLVRPVGSGFEIVAGECRYRAAKLAQLKAIPVIVRELTDEETLEIQVIENLQRRDLHPLEEADGYRQLMKRYHQKVEHVAARVGRSAKYVYDRVKLLALTKEAQKLFLDDKITAGHAVILARLSPKDQERCIGNESENHYVGWEGGLFESDKRLFDPDDEEREDRFKAVSVRELQAWVDKNVRFERAGPDPMLFPEAAQRVTEAQETKLKIIPITHDYHVPPAAKAEGERTYGPMSWKRADGLGKSKTCEHAVLGVIVVGFGRGEAFDVCAAKDKCKVHWSKEIAQRESTAKKKGGKASTKPAGKPSWQIEEEKRKAKAAAWEKVIPAVLEAFAAAVKKAPTKATGLLAQTIWDKLYMRHGRKAADQLIPLGTTADDFVRHVAFQILSDQIHDAWNADREVPKLGKAFGIDVAAIVKAATPKEPKPAAKPKRKAS